MFEIDYQKKIGDITSWIRETVIRAGFDSVIIAISGGIDSAVALSLAVKALGPEHVYVLMLPYGKLSDTHTEDAKSVIEHAGIPGKNIFLQDIHYQVDTMSEDIPLSEHIRRGNIMARVRMMYLYDLAKKHNVLVVGTENKSEYYLGYFTRFGDEASDIEPIRSLYKTQIWEMAKVLGVPEKIITKAPTAGLWEEQTDEKEFGFSYRDADKILYHYFEEYLPKEGIISLGLDATLVENVLKRVNQNDFKHHLPYVFS